jgi:hypothetical protein
MPKTAGGWDPLDRLDTLEGLHTQDIAFINRLREGIRAAAESLEGELLQAEDARSLHIAGAAALGRMKVLLTYTPGESDQGGR